MGVIKQYIAGMSAAIGSFCLGNVIGWSGSVEEKILNGNAYTFELNLDEWSWTASMNALGAACFCIPIGILTGLFGRKFMMLVLMAPCLLGWAFIIGAQFPFMLFIGRFLIGAALGCFSMLVPIYTTEIAQVESRGLMGCFFQLFLSIGAFFSFTFGSLLKVLIFNILCTIMPIIYVAIFIWMPESPVFLIQKGKTERAKKALKWLRGPDADVDAVVAAMTADGKKEKATWRQALARRTTQKGLFISIMLIIFQQLSGVNAVIFYVSSIFQKADTALSPSTCTIIFGAVGVFALILPILFVDRFGRRLFLILSGALTCLSLFILGVYFKFLMDSNVGWLPVITVYLFLFGFSLGFGPVTWLVMAEILAEDVKPFCGAIVTICCTIFVFGVVKLFPICMATFGAPATFWAFAVITFFSCIFVLFCVPETRGKTFDEIQAMLGGN